MNKPDIACSYFPTQVVFVDDKPNYLTSLTGKLDRNLIYKCFYDPDQALNFLNNKYQPNFLPKKWIKNFKEDEKYSQQGFSELSADQLAYAYIHFELAAIWKQVFSTKRFDEISLIVVDYAMPSMNGVEFCRQLKQHPAKKIMLTGQASYELGVKALNEGIIDKFIIKDLKDFRAILNQSINELQFAYFQELSEPIVKSLMFSSKCALSEPAFIKIFNKICQEHNIVEYYLVTDYGAFLMLDIHGNQYILAVTDQAEVDRLAFVAKENEGPKHIINALKNHKKFVFFFSERDEYSLPVDGWDNILHPATELIGKNNTYYYHLITNSDWYADEIDKDKIMPYYDYMKEK